MSRYARRKDDSHKAVVDAFRAAGCSWLNIDSPQTAGAPDGILGVAGRTLVVEIKAPKATKKRAETPETGLRATQKAWADSWRGSAVHVVTTPAQALELVNLVRLCGREAIWLDVAKSHA